MISLSFTFILPSLLLDGIAARSSTATYRIFQRFSSHTSSKPAHVRSYTGKDGSVVRAYNRAVL
jgi:hypothetical protein